MNPNQMTIFDIMYPKYKINKPIRLIELDNLAGDSIVVNVLMAVFKELL